MEVKKEHTIENIVQNHLTEAELKVFNRIYYGREDQGVLNFKKSTVYVAESKDFQLAGYAFTAADEETRRPRIIKIGLVQHSIIKPTDKSAEEQREAIFEKVRTFIEIAASEGVNVLCLQETWSMPFFLCTKEKEKWSAFAESTHNGPSVQFLTPLAKQYKMVIISPILENDEGTWWNTAVVINDDGIVLGKHRKNHLPSVGSFSETSYYLPGDTGHPVFDTTYGKLAVNICYGRHHALNWLMFALNGAEVVFNPAATIAEFGESFWGIEARCAAVANSYFTCSINRVGTETFYVKRDEEEKKISRTYYGSSYVTGPDGCRTPGLSRTKDGLLIAQLDLNLCRQVKDLRGFNMTARLDMYADELRDAINK